LEADGDAIRHYGGIIMEVNRKTRNFGYIILFIVWVVVQHFSEAHYGEDCWVTDQWLIMGGVLYLVTITGAYQLERQKAICIKIIWPGGSSTIDTGNPFCRIPAILDPLTGKILVPEYWVYALGGWIVPMVYPWPGGKEKGYIMLPGCLVRKYGVQVALNISDMEFYIGKDRHMRLPREQYHWLYRTCIEKKHGWSYERKVGWGTIPYFVDESVDLKLLGDSKRRWEWQNEATATMETTKDGYREELSAKTMLDISAKESKVEPTPGFQKEQKIKRKEDED